MKTKTLPAIRIDSQTDSNMIQALRKVNDDSLVKVSQQDFRRLCYEFTSQKILLGEKIKLR